MATSGTATDGLEHRNAEYASNFTKGDLTLPPAKQYLVLTCMDARIDPAAAFGIEVGDAHVIRNAGASAKDGLRSVIISQQLLNTKEILLVKHTDCGMTTFKNEQAHGLVAERLGDSAATEISTLDFLPFPDADKAVEDDVKYLKNHPAIPKEVVISGWVYDVKSGKVNRIV